MEQTFKCECCNYETKQLCHLVRHNKTITHLKKTSIVPVNMDDYKKLQALTNELQLKYDRKCEIVETLKKDKRHQHKIIDNLKMKLNLKLDNINKKINKKDFIKNKKITSFTIKSFKILKKSFNSMTNAFRRQKRYTEQSHNTIDIHNDLYNSLQEDYNKLQEENNKLREELKNIT